MVKARDKLSPPGSREHSVILTFPIAAVGPRIGTPEPACRYPWRSVARDILIAVGFIPPGPRALESHVTNELFWTTRSHHCPADSPLDGDCGWAVRPRCS